jgi:phosphoserine phosphatase
MSDFLEKHPIQLTEGVERLIEKLHEQNILVYLVSGGFRQVVKIFF